MTGHWDNELQSCQGIYLPYVHRAAKSIRYADIGKHQKSSDKEKVWKFIVHLKELGAKCEFPEIGSE